MTSIDNHFQFLGRVMANCTTPLMKYCINSTRFCSLHVSFWIFFVGGFDATYAVQTAGGALFPSYTLESAPGN